MPEARSNDSDKLSPCLLRMSSANNLPQTTDNMWARDIILRCEIPTVINKYGLLNW